MRCRLVRRRLGVRLAEAGVPFAIIFTKADKMGPVALERQIEEDKRILSGRWETLPDMLVTSSETGRGRDEVLSYIDNVLKTL